MEERQRPNSVVAPPPPPATPISGGGTAATGRKGAQHPNPPDPTIPDAATLKDQWRFAIRQYSRWYSHAWGTAILAGVSFFALGWVIKGSNPIPSWSNPDPADEKSPPPPGSSQAG